MNLSGLIVASDAAYTPPGVPPISRIFTVTPDGTRMTTLVSGGVNMLPAWSPEGGRVSFMRQPTPGVLAQVFIVDVVTNKLTQLTQPPLSGSMSAWSPDGSMIVFSSPVPGTDHNEVWTVPVTGGQPRRLTNTTGAGVSRSGTRIRWAINASYTPDGGSIVFTSTQSGHSAVWIMDASGGNQRLLFDGAPDANVPTISPDGSLLACFSGFESERGQVALWVGGVGRSITDVQDPYSADEPAWSPTGDHLIYQSDRPIVGDTPQARKARTWICSRQGTDHRVLFDFTYGAGRRPWRL